MCVPQKGTEGSNPSLSAKARKSYQLTVAGFFYFYLMDTTNFLDSSLREFRYYKSLGEKTITQLQDDDLSWQYHEEANSIAIIVKHMHGNMLSRWTDFLTTDGEKEWRNRDGEFINDKAGKSAVLKLWQEGWDSVFNAISHLSPEDLDTIVYIRNQGHTVTEAIQRQIAHYAYHTGQIVLIGKMITGDKWQSLSIPKNKSADFNQTLFSEEKSRKHFTDTNQ